MKPVIKLTECRFDENGVIKQSLVLIGVESIIKVEEGKLTHESIKFGCSKISSRAAMVATTHVVESIEKIHELINE